LTSQLTACFWAFERRRWHQVVKLILGKIKCRM
jgi:hypothetical protein